MVIKQIISAKFNWQDQQLHIKINSGSVTSIITSSTNKTAISEKYSKNDQHITKQHIVMTKHSRYDILATMNSFS